MFYKTGIIFARVIRKLYIYNRIKALYLYIYVFIIALVLAPRGQILKIFSMLVIITICTQLLAREVRVLLFGQVLLPKCYATHLDINNSSANIITSFQQEKCIEIRPTESFRI